MQDGWRSRVSSLGRENASSSGDLSPAHWALQATSDRLSELDRRAHELQDQLDEERTANTREAEESMEQLKELQREVMAALEIAPTYERAQDLLLDIVGAGL